MSYYLVVRRYAPFATFGGGFEGDVRDQGSVDPNATARTIGVVVFDTVSVQAYMGYSSGSTFEGAGQWVSKVIGRHFSQVATSISDERRTVAGLSFTVHTAGANPLVPVVAPDIDTFVDFEVAFQTNGLLVSGTVRGDTFPNGEVILLDSQLSGALLFDFRTTGGRTFGPAGTPRRQCCANPRFVQQLHFEFKRTILLAKLCLRPQLREAQGQRALVRRGRKL